MTRPVQNVYFKDTEGLQALYLDAVPGEDPKFNPKVIEEIEKQTDLIFTPEDLEAGKVCYANTEEVLPAFRTSFSTADLHDYIRGTRKSQIFLEAGAPGEIYLPYPGDSEFFWQQATLGRR